LGTKAQQEPGARYYDPAIARFLSPDSIVQFAGNPQSLARYSYALNNPLAYIDPTGHFSIGSFFGSLFGGFLGGLTFFFTGNPILAGAVAGGVSGAFSGNPGNAIMGAVMGGFSGALGSVVQANFGAAGSIAMVGIGAGSAVAKGGWSSLAYMGAGMVGGAAGYGLGGYLDQNTAGPYSLGNNAGTTEDNLKANASFPDRCPIPEDVVNDLKPYAYDQNGNPIDLSQMVLHKGLPGWLPNQDALAYTGSSTDIYWNPARLQYPSEYFDAVIGHEAIIHTQQYLTIPGFSSKYFFEMLIHGTGPSNIYEAPAYKLQSTIFNALIIKYSQ
jgi:RHS repeat-associated protein